MTKVLFWNIEDFSDVKIDNSSGAADPDRFAGGLTLLQTSDSRIRLIQQTLNETAPDIIVIIEVQASQNKISSTAQDNGGLSGAVLLLNRLRAGGFMPAIESPEWRMVPPLYIEDGETIAVLYRGESGAAPNLVRRYCTGPNLWSGGRNGKSRLPDGPNSIAAGQAYDAVNNPTRGLTNFEAMLVPPPTMARTIPAGALHNGRGDVPENTIAARVKLRAFDAANPAVPGALINFGNDRLPLMVTFTETDAANTVTRNLTIVAVHGPAGTAAERAAGVDRPEDYITTLSGAFEVATPLGNLETRLVGGDFNASLLEVDGQLRNVYDPLTGLQYQLLLVPQGNPPSPPPAPLEGYKGYFATHIILGPQNPAELEASKLMWSTAAAPPDLSYYPGYGYIGNNLSTSSLDNILVQPPVAGRMATIMNQTVGSPFDKVNNPAGNPPQGTLPLPAAILNPPADWRPWPPFPTAPAFEAVGAQQLMTWAYYGRIYSTSDHFALFADV